MMQKIKKLNKNAVFFLLKKQLEHSYSPYSRFCVSCIVETKYNNRYNYYCGNNIENVSYGLTICAERVALFNYLTNKKLNEYILNIYILASNGKDFVDYIYPCGACLGVMNEFLREENHIYCFSMLKKWKRFVISDLLPFRFEIEKEKKKNVR